MPKYGFHSKKDSRRRDRETVYLNKEGKEVAVTYVTDDINDDAYKWEDKKFVGEVTTCMYARKTEMKLLHLVK